MEEYFFSSIWIGLEGKQSAFLLLVFIHSFYLAASFFGESMQIANADDVVRFATGLCRYDA